MIKKILLGLLGFLIILIIWQIDLVWYGIQQGMGQMKIVLKAKPVEFYLEDPEFPDSLKYKLELVQEVRRFAVDSLSLKPTDNYTTVYNQFGMPVLWVVTASEPFQLKPVEWEFPVLGAFSYKGFFDYGKAESLKNSLDQQGYDTNIRTVNGWSTLGWFKDPILTNMLYQSEGDLADLIIHELTHGTLYVKDSVNFNENLATFVGQKGAEKYLIHKYGSGSPQHRSYLERRSDRDTFSSYVLTGAEKLDSLYKTFTPAMENKKKMDLKSEMIQKIIQNLDTVSFHQQEKYQDYFEGFQPNNAFFMSFIRYRSKLDQIEALYRQKFNSNLSRFLDYLKSEYTSL
ncbi:MAG: aminopeptidase [Candidatus Cyclobacteriaceae bacterium M3_2C_046]